MHSAPARPIVHPAKRHLATALTCVLTSAAFWTTIASPTFAQGQPAPGLAPLQPKVPMQPNLPTGPKVFNPTGPAPDLVFVTQAMTDNVQRRAIVVKNIGNNASKATSVGCQGGGDLPPPEKFFAFVDVLHAVKALAPGETYEHMQAPSAAPLTSYECSIRAPEGERVTTNNSFKWKAGQMRANGAFAAPIEGKSPVIAFAKKPDIALQSITLAQAHKTAMNETKISFRVNAKNMGNAVVAGAQVKCGAGATAPEIGKDYWTPAYRTQALVPYTGVSEPGDAHIIAFEILLHPSYVTAGKSGQIICDLVSIKQADDTNGNNNRVESGVLLPDNAPPLHFPILPR
jgi:hypothetical protein